MVGKAETAERKATRRPMTTTKGKEGQGAMFVVVVAGRGNFAPITANEPLACEACMGGLVRGFSCVAGASPTLSPLFIGKLPTHSLHVVHTWEGEPHIELKRCCMPL